MSAAVDPWINLPSSASDRLALLRRILTDKFPTAETRQGGALPTGIPSIDELEGGLRRSTVTEWHGSSGAGALFIHAMLAAAAREKFFVALVDASKAFDPATAPKTGLSRLLLVSCEEPGRAIKATDLLLRDGNLSLILLDLQSATFAQLRKIPASTWHRFQRLAEQTTAALVILTPQPMVEGARVRIAGISQWNLGAQRQWRKDLLQKVKARVVPRHSASILPSIRESA